MSSSPAVNRRADARRSRARILDAAVQLLNTDPEARVEGIAEAAGVTRQTVYAHFPTRQQLLEAVIDRVTDEVVAVMDAADPDDGPAADALLRVLDSAAVAVQRYGALLHRIGSVPVSPEADQGRHEPVADRLKRVIQRGQRAGEFDERLSPDWLAAVTIGVAHATAAQVEAGRMTSTEATEALHTALLRILAATTSLHNIGNRSGSPRR